MCVSRRNRYTKPSQESWAARGSHVVLTLRDLLCCILQIFRWVTQRALAIGPLGEGGDSGRHTLSAPPKIGYCMV